MALRLFLLPVSILAVGCLDPAADDEKPRLGDSEETIRVATWNIENFPKHADSPELVRETVIALDLDLVAVQEIADETAFWDVVAGLPDYAGNLSPHEYFDGTYQKIGYLYRSSTLQLGDVKVLFTHDTFAFPRPAFQATVTSRDTGADFFAVAVHLKAGRSDDNHRRRVSATTKLSDYAEHLADTVDDDIVILGDFNEQFTSENGTDVFEPFVTAPFDLRTQELAENGAYTFVPSGAMLDHIVVSDGLAGEVVPDSESIPSLDLAIEQFDATLSDHLPVIIELTPVPDAPLN